MQGRRRQAGRESDEETAAIALQSREIAIHQSLDGRIDGSSVGMRPCGYDSVGLFERPLRPTNAKRSDEMDVLAFPFLRATLTGTTISISLIML
jgi:hypothetical protein